MSITYVSSNPGFFPESIDWVRSAIVQNALINKALRICPSNKTNKLFKTFIICIFVYHDNSYKYSHKIAIMTSLSKYVRGLACFIEPNENSVIFKPLPAKLYFKIFQEHQDYSHIPIQLLQKPFLSQLIPDFL